LSSKALSGHLKITLGRDLRQIALVSLVRFGLEEL
jgi:hypothetical protein